MPADEPMPAPATPSISPPAAVAPAARSRSVVRRLPVYMVLGLALTIFVLLLSMDAIRLFTDRTGLGDFSAFYTVGHILNEGPAAAIYDPVHQKRVYYELLPHAPPEMNLPYAHAPFEAIIFRPLALLPYDAAYVIWQLFSLGLFWTAAALLCRTLNSGIAAIDLCISMFLFAPFTLGLFSGQVNVIGFFAVTMAIYLERRQHPAAAGMVLALAFYKPTLLLFILPMLPITGRWRVLGGLALGGLALALVSLLVVGWTGCLAYVQSLLSFGGNATAGASVFKLSIYADLNAFFRGVTGSGSLAMLLLGLVAAVVVPMLAFAWWRSRRAEAAGRGIDWSLALTWTMLVNLYSPKYDTVLLVPALLLSAHHLRHRQPRAQGLLWALGVTVVLLCTTSWLPPIPVGGSAYLQLFTLVVAALGILLLRVGLRPARDAQAAPSLSDHERAMIAAGPARP